MLGQLVTLLISTVSSQPISSPGHGRLPPPWNTLLPWLPGSHFSSNVLGCSFSPLVHFLLTLFTLGGPGPILGVSLSHSHSHGDPILLTL